MKYIDLTHAFTDNMPVYPGDPPSSLKQTASIKKDTYTDHQINSLMHVGTHMDSPLHMIEGGKTIDQIDLENFFGKGVLIDARNKPIIDESALLNIDIPNNSVLLIYSGFAQKFKTPSYFEGFPIITEGFANKMVEKKVKTVAMDFLGPDTDATWPIHKILLGNEILIIENVANLDKLLNIKDFDIIALPAKYQAEAAPVRLIACIND